MYNNIIWITIFFLLPHCRADNAYGDRPRGVSAEKSVLYTIRPEFQCLDGKKTIPFNQVNDDYCDCDDGSDEPGTSACPNGQFHCRNFGFRNLDIPSSRVNDFICDCCDGSDEWDSGVQCDNVCAELGKKAKQDAKAREAIITRGWAIRQGLAEEGFKLMEEKRSELEKMQRELEDLQPIKEMHEATKNDAEKRENDAKNEEDEKWNDLLEQRRKEKVENWFMHADLDKDGKLYVEDFKQWIATASGQEISDEDVKTIFEESTTINADILYKNYIKLRDIINKKPSLVNIDELAGKLTSKDQINEIGEKGDEHDSLDDDHLEPEPINEPDDNENYDEIKPDYTEQTRNLIAEADKQRNLLLDIKHKISELEAQIQDATNFLQFEYGPDHAWAPLKGVCKEINQGKYIYRLCLFERAVQKENDGHSEINLGNWQEWIPLDKSEKAGKFAAQMYSNGQQCWNGPQRSTRVIVECGETLELIDSKEPAKCEYEFKLRSPAACPDPLSLRERFEPYTDF